MEEAENLISALVDHVDAQLVSALSCFLGLGPAWVIGDLPNVINRVIKPHILGEKECNRCEKTPKASGVTWKGLYAGRRGAGTAIIDATNGNYAVAQAVLRHKTMDTTLRVYKKQITPQVCWPEWNCFRSRLLGK